MISKDYRKKLIVSSNSFKIADNVIYTKSFYSNCFIEAIRAWLKHPLTTKIKGNALWKKFHFHFQWIRNGFIHDFCESEEWTKEHPGGYHFFFEGQIRTFPKRYTKYLAKNNI